MIAELKKLFPEDFFSSDSAELIEFGRDWTRVFEPKPALIAFPRTTDDVAKLLKYCHMNKISVVPSGGRTGLAGGAVAANGEVVLSLSRMNKMMDVDVMSRTLRVQAGAVTEADHKH